MSNAGRIWDLVAGTEFGYIGLKKNTTEFKKNIDINSRLP